ncbi:hypothetical protein BJI49_10735 [Acetobacter pasteurianus]|uniref:hypothetical protein n=1 Tax=Acetobacter pasteurianus TaxID=438 RepID=UPI0002457205|nr:hypothetical protein [Acetobacter pasteurianus]RCL05375.1 hypothetical protein BJI49_10735 [Acetobacter pasteurianus]GAB31601.1 hypothetical protein APS_2203 [Acetobacter pasteurianus subsp. pasteurianus LMG 1262 = NBRC 106471]
MKSFLVASSQAIFSDKEESNVSKGIEKLRARTMKQHASCRAGKLYRWLFEHHETIRQARDDNISWEEIAEAARADGISIVSDRPGRKLIQWKWKRVCLALSKLTQPRSNNDVADRVADRPIMPSRLPSDWTPEFVEITQPDAQPVQQAPQSQALTVKRDILPANASKTMKEKIDKARFTLGQAKFDLTMAKEQIRLNDSQGAPMLAKEGEAKLPGLREIIKQRRAIYDRLLAGEDVPDEELEFKSPREREEEQYSD